MIKMAAANSQILAYVVIVGSCTAATASNITSDRHSRSFPANTSNNPNGLHNKNKITRAAIAAVGTSAS